MKKKVSQIKNSYSSFRLQGNKSQNIDFKLHQKEILKYFIYL